LGVKVPCPGVSGAEGQVKRKGVTARWGLKAAWSECAARRTGTRYEVWHSRDARARHSKVLYPLEPGAPGIGKTIGELAVRTKTGASIMAIVERDQRPIINPGPEQVLPAGATLIVVGERRMLNAFKQLMAQGSV
jgi:Trk K+ transport system NAD-binding subunit